MLYATLPPSIPVSWDDGGRVQYWVETSVWTAFSTHISTAVSIAAAGAVSAGLPRIIPRIFKSMTPDALMLKTWAAAVLRLALAKTALALSLGSVVSFIQIWFYPQEHAVLFGLGMAAATLVALLAIALPPAFSIAGMLDSSLSGHWSHHAVRRCLGPAW